MGNPFELLEKRLSNIENLLIDIKHTPPMLTPQSDKDELCTVPQASEYLSLSVPTIYGLIHKGDLPSMKRGKRCYFLKSDLMAYLMQGRRKSNAEIKNEVSKVVKSFNH